MNKPELQHEREIAEVQGDVRQSRGMNWVIVVFAIIILTIVIVGISVMLFPKEAMLDNQNANAAGGTVNRR
jgi:flagellar basal body-associated protein FliL